MARLHNPPSAEKILTILARLYADQMGVKVTVSFESEVKDDDRKAAV